MISAVFFKFDWSWSHRFFFNKEKEEPAESLYRLAYDVTNGIAWSVSVIVTFGCCVYCWAVRRRQERPENFDDVDPPPILARS